MIFLIDFIRIKYNINGPYIQQSILRRIISDMLDQFQATSWISIQIINSTIFCNISKVLYLSF